MILYDRYIPIQTLIIALLRNVMLTVPKGAWDTCDLIFLISQAFALALFTVFTCQTSTQYTKDYVLISDNYDANWQLGAHSTKRKYCSRRRRAIPAAAKSSKCIITR